jgi:hypothetical protein
MARTDAVEEYVAALQVRDWDRMGRTLTADVRREGVEGPETDAIDGREAYLKWSADLLDPLYSFTWTPSRFVTSASGKTILVEAISRYEPNKGDEAFGYRLAVVFELNEEGLIKHISFYWKTPRKRLAWDTIAGRDQ